MGIFRSAAMLSVSGDHLPSSGLVYLAFRVSFQETLERLVLSRQVDDGSVVDAVIIDTKGKAVGVATMVDDSDGTVMRVEGKVDQAAPQFRLATPVLRKVSVNHDGNNIITSVNPQ